MSKIVQAGPGIHVGDYVFARTNTHKSQINDNTSASPGVIEAHRLEKIRVAGKEMLKGKDLGNSCLCGGVDTSWLPLASPKYQISPDISDYIILPDLKILPATYPNRNMDAFPFNELTNFRTAIGRPAFATFIGKPVHLDHDNQVDERARGVILDATMTVAYGKWHVSILKAIDRSKDTNTANRILQKKGADIGHSMGALVEKTECSLPWCRFISDGITTCEHIAGGACKGRIIRGHLVYELLHDFNFVESSIISGEQASPTALSVRIMDL